MNYRFLSFFLSLAVTSIAVFYFITMQDGFPDGFLTDLGRARAKLYPPFIAFSIISGLYFVYIGLVETSRRIGMKFIGGAILYILVFGITAAIDVYYYMTLDDGMGG